MKKLTWKLELTIRVAEEWVADGFEATPERIRESLEDHLLGFCTEGERDVEVRTISTPAPKIVRQLQGYIIDENSN